MGNFKQVNEITIRDALGRYADALAALLTQLGYPQDRAFVLQKLANVKLKSSMRVFVAEKDDGVVGFLSFSVEPPFHRHGNIGTITAMCVSHPNRGHGIGRRLIERAELFAKESGCARIAVASGIQRLETHTFYRHCGFEERTRRFVKDF